MNTTKIFVPLHNDSIINVWNCCRLRLQWPTGWSASLVFPSQLPWLDTGITTRESHWILLHWTAFWMWNILSVVVQLLSGFSTTYLSTGSWPLVWRHPKRISVRVCSVLWKKDSDQFVRKVFTVSFTEDCFWLYLTLLMSICLFCPSTFSKLYFYHSPLVFLSHCSHPCVQMGLVLWMARDRSSKDRIGCAGIWREMDLHPMWTITKKHRVDSTFKYNY